MGEKAEQNKRKAAERSRAGRLRVTHKGYDDLGAVLRSLGPGYEHSEISLRDLEKERTLQGCEVLFINCTTIFLVRDRIAANIRQFVNAGGSLYVSDLAHPVIDSAFPGSLRISAKGMPGSIDAHVVDEGLAELIGPRIRLNYDSPFWATIQEIGAGVQTHLEGAGLASLGPLRAKPLLISFAHGQGHVVYTTFHNHAQVSEAEAKLLRYLVFRPLLAGAASSAAAYVRAQAATLGKEIFAAVDPGATSDRYTLNLAGPTALLFVLSWEGGASLALRVYDPQGSLVREQQTAEAPLVLEIAGSTPGAWSCEVIGTQVPYPNFPFVLTVARGSGAAASSPNPALPLVTSSAAAATSPTVLSDILPVFFLVDNSTLAGSARVAALSQGLAALIQTLSRDSVASSKVHLGLIAIGGRPATSLTLESVDRVPPLSLEARGLPQLATGLTVLKQAISEAVDRGLRKGIVFIILASAPGDTWRGEAQDLIERGQRGEVNVMCISLGDPQVSAGLQVLATLPSLAVDGLSGAEVQACMLWLSSLITVMARSAPGSSLDLPLPPENVKVVR